MRRIGRASAGNHRDREELWSPGEAYYAEASRRGVVRIYRNRRILEAGGKEERN